MSSEDKSMLPIDQLKTLSETSCDGICRIIRQALAGQEKMMGMNIDAVQEFIRKSGEQLERTCREMGQVDPVKGWPQLLTSNFKSGAAINLLLLRIAGQLRKNLTTAAQEQLQAMQNEMLAEVNKYTSMPWNMANSLPRSNGHHGGKVRLVA